MRRTRDAARTQRNRQCMRCAIEGAHIGLAHMTHTHMRAREYWAVGWAARIPALIYCNSWKINVLLLNSWDCVAPASGRRAKRTNLSRRKMGRSNEKLFRWISVIAVFTLFFLFRLCTAPSSVYFVLFVFISMHARFDNARAKFFARRLNDLFTLHFLFWDTNSRSPLRLCSAAVCLHRPIDFSSAWLNVRSNTGFAKLKGGLKGVCVCVENRHVTTPDNFCSRQSPIIIIIIACARVWIVKIVKININYDAFDRRLVEIYFIKCEMCVTSHTYTHVCGAHPTTIAMCGKSYSSVCTAYLCGLWR